MSSLNLTRMVQVKWTTGRVTCCSITEARELARLAVGSVWLKELDRQIAESEAGACCKQP